MQNTESKEKISESMAVTYEPNMPVEKLEFNNLNPRCTKLIPEKELKLDELCGSIIEMGGIIVPLVVFPIDDKFIVLDGERRLRAARKLKMKTVPVNVVPRRLSDAENLSKMFNIHLQREQWNTAARAVSLGKLKELMPEATPEQLKTMAAMSDSEYGNAQRILTFSSELQDKAVAGVLNPNYLIEMAKALDNLGRYYSDILKEYGRDYIIQKWISKINRKIIRNNTHFRFVGKICRRLAEDKARNLLKRVIDDDNFGIDEAWDIAEEEMAADMTDIFVSKCEKFLKDLHNLPISRQSPSDMKELEGVLKQVLTEIKEKIKRIERWTVSK